VGCLVAVMLLASFITVVHGQEDEHTFRRALPGYVYRFPADHAALILNFALNGGITQDISPPKKGVTSGFSSPFFAMLSGRHRQNPNRVGPCILSISSISP